jgi:hypothetical protein
VNSRNRPSTIRTRTRAARPSRRVRLRLEVLEDRCTPSAQILETLGTAVPGVPGAFRINDFEPNGLNNRGDVLFGDDLGTANDPSTFFGEGVFLRSHGQETVLGYSTGPAPGGGNFDSGFLGPSALNDQGDAAFVFLVQPAGSPFGVNAGTYRYDHNTGQVTPVVIPGVTAAPGGGTFTGSFFTPGINNAGVMTFAGIVPTANGVHIPGEDYPGVGMGAYEAGPNGTITTIVAPGDAAPGQGKTFDLANNPQINNKGDVAFLGHIAGEPAAIAGFPPQSDLISALSNLYVKDGATGKITLIAHAGDPAPGGGNFRQTLFPWINDRGDVLFTADLTPAPDVNETLGVFLYSGGKIVPVARPGDAVPGGGHIVTTSIVGGNTHFNNSDDVVFNAVLDTDVDHNGTLDTGLFEWSHGKVTLLARSGQTIPGVGTVLDLVQGEIVTPPPPILTPNSGVVINDRGQVLFAARLTDGRSVLVLLTPDNGQGNGAGQGSVNASAVLTSALIAGSAAPATGTAGSGSHTSDAGSKSNAAVPQFHGGPSQQVALSALTAAIQRHALDDIFGSLGDDLASELNGLGK